MVQRTITIGSVDVEKLETDADFAAETERLLPKALDEAAAFAAEETWNALQSGFRGSRLQLSNRYRFIQETVDQLKDQQDFRQQVRDHLLGNLREMREKYEAGQERGADEGGAN